MKKEEGITLVALIITIIILIILAAITLQTVVVDGILNLASQGSINYSQAQSNEVSMLDEMNGKLNDVTSTLGDGNGDSEAGKDDPNSVYNVLKVGDYVEYYYKSEKDPILCKVLYDREFNEKNSTKYGIQIVSIENDLDTVTLGYEDPRIETDAPEDVKNAPKDTDEGKLTRAIWSYNNAIETLNKAGEKYLSSNVKSVRCLGTIPDAPNTDVGYFTSDKDWFNEKYKNTIKGEEVSSDFGKSVMESRDDYTQLKVANRIPCVACA